MRNGSAHVWFAQGMGTSRCRQIPRTPFTLTKWRCLERTGSREIPAAAIFGPRRRPGHLVDAHHERAGRGEGRDEQSQQQPADAQT